jgi:hypothetical protein
MGTTGSSYHFTVGAHSQEAVYELDFWIPFERNFVLNAIDGRYFLMVTVDEAAKRRRSQARVPVDWSAVIPVIEP